MSLSLQNDQKQHLMFITSKPISVLNKILSNISSGEYAKYNHEGTLNDESHATQALVKFLIDAKRLNIAEKDFLIQATSLTGMSDDKSQELWNFLNTDSALIDLISSDEYKFRDLEWRLEAKIASRFLHSNSPDPKIVLKIYLDSENTLNHRLNLSKSTKQSSVKDLLVECNANSLVHIIDHLESVKTTVNAKRLASQF